MLLIIYIKQLKKRILCLIAVVILFSQRYVQIYPVLFDIIVPQTHVTLRDTYTINWLCSMKRMNYPLFLDGMFELRFDIGYW